jgi:hypothetical protein
MPEEICSQKAVPLKINIPFCVQNESFRLLMDGIVYLTLFWQRANYINSVSILTRLTYYSVNKALSSSAPFVQFSL